MIAYRFFTLEKRGNIEHLNALLLVITMDFSQFL